MPTNPYEQLARQAKATALADLIDAWEIDSLRAAELTDQQWKYFSQIAQVNEPSMESRKVVIRLLRDREIARSAVAEFKILTSKALPRSEFIGATTTKREAVLLCL